MGVVIGVFNSTVLAGSVDGREIADDIGNIGDRDDRRAVVDVSVEEVFI